MPALEPPCCFPAASPGLEIEHRGLKTGLSKAVKNNLTQDYKAAPALTRIHIFHISKP